MSKEDSDKEEAVSEGQSNGQKTSRVPGLEGPHQNQAEGNQETSGNSLYITMGESDHN